MNKLLEDLNKFKAEEKDAQFSILSFSGGKWKLTEKDLEKFYMDYYMTIQQYPQQKFTFIEKINKQEIFKLFFDLEIPKGLENNETYKPFNSTSKKLEILQQTINDVINDSFANVNSSENIITERKINDQISKIHINYYTINVNQEICKSLVQKIKIRLIQDNNLYMYNYIDTSVYNTGLRMYGSIKSQKDMEKEVEYLKKIEQYDEKKYQQKYKFTKEDQQSYTQFKKTLIKLTESKPKLTQMNEDFKKYIKEQKKEKQIQCISFGQNLQENVKTELNQLLNKLFQHEQEIQIQKIVYQQNPTTNIYLTTNIDYCPFKQRKHQRTSNPVYFLVNSKGIFQKCYDEDCQKYIYPKTKETYWTCIKLMYKEIYEQCKSVRQLIQVKYVNTEKNEKIDEDLREQLLDCIYKQTHWSIAKTAYQIYGKEFRIDNLKSPEWYKFDGIRFKKTEIMDQLLSDDYCKYFESMKRYDSSKIADLQDFIQEEDEEKEYDQQIKKIIYKLEDYNFKRQIKNQLQTIIYNNDQQFYQKLDTNPYLLGFENGIYDLKTCQFRQGHQSDYLTYSTGYNYVKYDENNEEIKKIYQFISQIITNEEIREYLLQTLGKGLLGIADEKFYMWIGNGSNGKSSLVNLIEKTLGDYSYSPDVSLLTEKRKSSSNASPDIFMMKGKRIFTFQEPDPNDKLRTGKMKQYTGGDSIVARELFKSPIIFKSQGTMILSSNSLLEISDLTEGAWRRIRVIDFKSKFVEGTPKQKNEFPIQYEIKDNIESGKWSQYFMSILIHYYEKVKQNNYKIYEPKEVIDATDKYKKMEDLYNSFMTTKIQISENPNNYISQTDLYTQFIEDWKRKNPDNKFIPRKKFVLGSITRIFNINYEWNPEIDDNVYYNLEWKNYTTID